MMWPVSGAKPGHVYRCLSCRRATPKGITIQTCPVCESPFRRGTVRQVFCSFSCRDKARDRGDIAQGRACSRCGGPVRVGKNLCGCRKVRTCRDCGGPVSKQRRYCDPCRDSRAQGWRLKGKAERRGAVQGGGRFSVTEIGDRDAWLCHLCFTGVDPTLPTGHPGSGTLDHLIALSHGGSHEGENIYLAHRLCNISRGNREVSMARRFLVGTA